MVDDPTDGIEVVVAHSERATLRVGEVFVKIDADPARGEAELAAMAAAPVPTAPVLWSRPLVLALGRVPGVPLGRLGSPSTASRAAWVAAGAMVRRLHDAPLPPWPARRPDPTQAAIDDACRWIVDSGTLPADVVDRNRTVVDVVARPYTPVFVHGDLQADHVFVVGDDVSAVLDWSEAGPGDPAADLATMTLGHAEHLADVVAGYGADVDPELVRAHWSLRSLLNLRWLVEHGFDVGMPGGEADVLRSHA